MVNVSVSLNIGDPIGTEQQPPVTSSGGGAAVANECTAKGYTQFKCATAENQSDEWEWDGHGFTFIADNVITSSAVRITNRSGADADYCWMNDWWKSDGGESTNIANNTTQQAINHIPGACLYIKLSP